MAKLKELEASLVSPGAPVDGGCCWVSFKEHPTLPTSAVDKMGTFSDFESLGELSTDGITEGREVEVNEFRGFHNTVLCTSDQKLKTTYKTAFLEISRASVAKLRYGSKNVSEQDGLVTKVWDKYKSQDIFVLIFDLLMKNGSLERVIIPRASISEYDETSYKSDELIAYGMTFMPLECNDGYSFVKYTAKPKLNVVSTPSNLPAAA